MIPQSEISVGILTHPDHITAARRLQAQCYLRREYVDHITADGTIHDEWVERATYFGARSSTGRIVGVSRLISNPDRASRLPVRDEFQIEEPWRQWIDAVAPQELCEVSALAVAPGCGVVGGKRVLDLLIAAMGVHSLASGQPYWVAALDVRVLHLLRRLHDVDLTCIGPARLYMGSLTVPVRLDLLAQVRSYERHKPAKNRYFLEHVEIDLTADPLPALRAASVFPAGLPHALPSFRSASPRSAPTFAPLRSAPAPFDVCSLT